MVRKPRVEPRSEGAVTSRLLAGFTILEIWKCRAEVEII